jgi:carboxyl-terminal processing protease
VTGALAFLLFAEPNQLEEALRRFAGVYGLVERESASEVDPNQAIYEGAIPGMLRQLDPHTVFFTAGQFDQLREMEKSTSKGFGTVVSVLPGRVIVLQTSPGTPSSRADIQPGDEILAVNGIRLDWLQMEQIIGLLGETRRREAKLDVRRQGTPRMLQFTMVPEELASPSVDRAYELRSGVGYVRVTSFEVPTGKQLKEAIDRLGGGALKGLVLDLRNNPGGVIGSALEASALFLPAGKKLVSLRGRSREAEETKVPDKWPRYDFPLVVLVNEKSASASEILAGAMQDYDRATVVGSATFGKGLVQSVFPLSQNNGIALTTAFYFTPSGRSIQRPLKEGLLEGQTPRWASLEAQTEFSTEGGRKVRGGGGIEPDVVVPPERQTRLRTALDASGFVTQFATEAIQKLGKVEAGFEVPSSLMDDFRVYLSLRQIQPGVGEWSTDRDWIRSRLHQEIFNQALGVEKGDEVESRRDPVVLRALEALAAAR